MLGGKRATLGDLRRESLNEKTPNNTQVVTAQSVGSNFMAKDKDEGRDYRDNLAKIREDPLLMIKQQEKKARCVRMYVCMYVCMYGCMYVCVCMYVCMYVCVCVRVHACIFQEQFRV
jgi:hypothetical protein